MTMAVFEKQRISAGLSKELERFYQKFNSTHIYPHTNNPQPHPKYNKGNSIEHNIVQKNYK